MIRDLTRRHSVNEVFGHQTLSPDPEILYVPQPHFLPLSVTEGNKLGIPQFDIILITGDAYVDHPSFGTALIRSGPVGRGFSVGIIAQPDGTMRQILWRLENPASSLEYRRETSTQWWIITPPISNGGAMMSIHPVESPAAGPGNDCLHKPGARTLSRCPMIIIGGIEASLRRFAHYDYWQDRVRQSDYCRCAVDLLFSVWESGRLLRLPGVSTAVTPSHQSGMSAVRLSAWKLQSGAEQSQRDLLNFPVFQTLQLIKISYARGICHALSRTGSCSRKADCTTTPENGCNPESSRICH